MIHSCYARVNPTQPGDRTNFRFLVCKRGILLIATIGLKWTSHFQKTVFLFAHRREMVSHCRKP
jgi:hypothetical protein